MNKLYQPSNENKLSETIHSTKINGLYFIPHKYFPDNRGFYTELARVPEIEAITGTNFTIKQLNQSRSNTNVIRGFHAEDWNKLVTVTSGLCFCALADFRKESSTFGLVETMYLGTAESALKGSIYISKGIGNSLCVTQGPADYVYAVDALWGERDASKDTAINLFDTDLAVEWPIPLDQMIISDRDRESINLKAL